MQLMRLAEVPNGDRDKVYRYSPARAVMGASVIVAICIWLILFGRQTGLFLFYFFAGMLLLFTLLYQRLVFARFRPSNWLVRVTDNGLFIQFRSYLNYHFDGDDATVLFLPYPEIRSARLVRQKQLVSDGRGSSQTKIRKLVELELGVDPAQIEQALVAEYARQAPKDTRWFGSSYTTYRHYPISLAPSGYLQIEWGVVPGSRAFVDALRKYTAIAPPAKVSQEQDYLHLDKLSREKQEEKLLQLAKQGDTIAAVTIARELYSYDLAEAKTFVEGLIATKRGKDAS
jgi:hypothetical protein